MHVRRMDLQGKGMHDMQDPDSGRLTACEWHDDYPEDDCQPCLEAFANYEDMLYDLYREMS
jgi:hypothetical protein